MWRDSPEWLSTVQTVVPSKSNPLPYGPVAYSGSNGAVCFDMLFVRMEAIEEKLGMNSGNSSEPSSSVGYKIDSGICFLLGDDFLAINRKARCDRFFGN